MWCSTSNTFSITATKFYEIIYLRKTIIYVGNIGLVIEFIVSNKLGIHILPEELNVLFGEILQRGAIENFNYNHEFDVSEFSCSFITDKLNKWIIIGMANARSDQSISGLPNPI